MLLFSSKPMSLYLSLVNLLQKAKFVKTVFRLPVWIRHLNESVLWSLYDLVFRFRLFPVSIFIRRSPRFWMIFDRIFDRFFDPKPHTWTNRLFSCFLILSSSFVDFRWECGIPQISLLLEISNLINRSYEWYSDNTGRFRQMMVLIYPYIWSMYQFGLKYLKNWGTDIGKSTQLQVAKN